MVIGEGVCVCEDDFLVSTTHGYDFLAADEILSTAVGYISMSRCLLARLFVFVKMIDSSAPPTATIFPYLMKIVAVGGADE